MLASTSPFALSSSPPPPPPLISSHRLSSSLFSPLLSCRRSRRRRPAATLSISSSATTSSNAREEAFTGRGRAHLAELEGYGVDPSEVVSRSPAEKPMRRPNRREVVLDGRLDRKRAAPRPPEETKPPRTTHKLLQVLGGKARRKKLLSPKGMDVRPMMEVVKGAAFDILQAAGGCPASLRPGRWLDLYSGTGSVGIEAISRGCSEVHFVEMDPWVVSEVLRPNLEWTGFLDVSVIHTLRVERFLAQVEDFPADRKFDYISVTPPYTAVDYGVLMEQLSRSPVIGEDCFIMVEYPLETSMVDSCGHLIKVADRRFGRTNLIIYGPKWAEKKRKSDRPK